MKITDLTINEYNPYFSNYLSKLPKSTNLISGFKEGNTQVFQFFNTISEDKLDYRYEADKWSIKEVFQHIIDTERVFIYRCFRISRHDKTPLTGFEQDDYVLPSNADKKSLDDLLEEYKTTRNYSINLLQGLNKYDLKFLGTVDGSPMSARAAAFIILGHEIHHINVIKELYL